MLIAYDEAGLSFVPLTCDIASIDECDIDAARDHLRAELERIIRDLSHAADRLETKGGAA